MHHRISEQHNLLVRLGFLLPSHNLRQDAGRKSGVTIAVIKLKSLKRY